LISIIIYISLEVVQSFDKSKPTKNGNWEGYEENRYLFIVHYIY